VSVLEHVVCIKGYAGLTAVKCLSDCAVLLSSCLGSYLTEYYTSSGTLNPTHFTSLHYYTSG